MVTHKVKHHIHTSGHPTVFAKACCLDRDKLEIAKEELKCSPFHVPLGFTLAHGAKKRRALVTMQRLLLPNYGKDSQTVPFAKHARPFKRLA
jgi:hypothetical protein